MKKKGSHVTTLFSLLLYALFTVLSLALVFVSVKAYQETINISDENTQIRSSISYVTNKIRAMEGEMRIVDVNGENALVIEEDYGSSGMFITYIFVYDGYLYESLVLDHNDFNPEIGEKITAVKEFNITEKGNGLYELAIKDQVEGNTYKAHVALRGNIVLEG